MPDESERQRRKQLMKALKAAERLKAESELPAAKDQLLQLIDWVDENVGDTCDHTMRLTLDYVRRHGLDEERVVAWLHQYGGYCDCEVAMNVIDACPALR